MFTARDIRVFPQLPPLTVTLSQQIYAQTDTPVIVYDRFKLSVLLSDGMSVVCGSQVYEAGLGDVLLFRPDELHCGRIRRRGEHRYLDLYLPPDLPQRMEPCAPELALFFTDRSSRRINLLSPDIQAREQILKLAEHCAELVGSAEPLSELRLFAGSLELLSLCASMYAVQREDPPENGTPPVVRTALRYIQRHSPEIKGLADIAEKAGCSVSYLTRTFRSLTGRTVNSYLVDCRLIHAKRLLRQGASVTESCFRTGFADCSHFIRVFKSREGVTPQVWAKQQEPQNGTPQTQDAVPGSREVPTA